MRKLNLYLFAALLGLAACKKSADKPVEGPSTGFAFDYMEVEENLFGAYLHLYGNFGDSSATSKVKISNTILTDNVSGEGIILEWKPWYIKVSIGNPDDNTGAGYVSVLNGGKETNKRMLNVWELSLLYKEPDEGTILKEVRFNAFLRADAGSHRNILTVSRPSSFAAASLAYWAIGGQGHSFYANGGMTISLENRAGVVIWSKPYKDNTSAPDNFQSGLLFKDGKFVLNNLRMHKKKATKISSLADGSTVPYIIDYDFRVEVIPLNQKIYFELDNTQSIKAGTFVTGPHGTQYDFEWEPSEAPNHMHNFTLEWSKTEPRFK